MPLFDGFDSAIFDVFSPPEIIGNPAISSDNHVLSFNFSISGVDLTPPLSQPRNLPLNGPVATRFASLEPHVITEIGEYLEQDLSSLSPFFPYINGAISNLVRDVFSDVIPAVVRDIDLSTVLTGGLTSRVVSNLANDLVRDLASVLPTFTQLFDYDNLAISPENALACRNYDQIIVFGDSLSDPGNLSAVLGGLFPPPPYFQGRLSNGPLWIDTLAPDLGFQPEQVLNFAFAGANTGRTNIALTTAGLNLPIQLPGLLDEIDRFTSTVGPSGANPNALYVVWAGANDFLTLPKAPEAALDAILDGVKNVASAVTGLARVGAETIAVANIPNLGLAPLVNQQDLTLEAIAFSIAFNVVLEYTLAQLEDSLGVDVVQIDTFSVSQAIAQRPSEFGFTNITTPLILQTTPANPQAFFFWDDFHPTTAVHSLIADTFERSLSTPTPSGVLNTSLGLVANALNSSGFQSTLNSLLTDLLPSTSPISFGLPSGLPPAISGNLAIPVAS
jgi:phospholipase/lecithinase/hemolysin